MGYNVIGVVVVVVMLPVDTTMAVMCHVLFVCCMHVHGSGCRCDYCMFSRSVDTCRRPAMLMMSHYELHDDELAWWHSFLSESHLWCVSLDIAIMLLTIQLRSYVQCMYPRKAVWVRQCGGITARRQKSLVYVVHSVTHGKMSLKER